MLNVVLLALRLAMIVALVAFLVVLLWVLWQELRLQTPQAWLVLLDKEGTERRRFSLATLTWIGRDPACWVHVDDEFTSSRHALIFWDANSRRWWIEDNLSRNGTYLNGSSTARAPLASGDVVQVGNVRLRFELESPPHSSFATLLQLVQRVCQHRQQQPTNQQEQAEVGRVG